MHKIMIRVAIATRDGHFLVCDEHGSMLPPGKELFEPRTSDLVAAQILHDALGLEPSFWVVCRQVGFVDSSQLDHANVLFGVEIPERIRILDSDLRWVGAAELHDPALGMYLQSIGRR